MVLLPYAASVMPFFLVALAWVSDLKGNSLETMDVQEYAALEQKQADFLRVQVEQRERRVALQTRLIAVEQMELQNKRLRKRKLPKTFRWFWEQPADLETVIVTVATQLKHMFDADLPSFKEHKQARENPAQEISSPVTDPGLWRDERGSNNQQDGCVPNGLTSDLFEGNMASDQESSSLPIMYLHSIPHTVRFSAQKNAYQGSDDGEDHRRNNHREKGGKKIVMLPGHRADHTQLMTDVQALVARFPKLQLWLDDGLPVSISKRDIIELTGLSSQAVARAK
ncbi:MAG: hypothetical protein J2P36_00330 [Ktedonobacteraceae bacterium]|nr:hypothetical protein [Ktedonobacteraceae bacterium]